MNELQAAAHLAVFENFLDELKQSLEKGFILPMGQQADLSNIRRKCYSILYHKAEKK